MLLDAFYGALRPHAWMTRRACSQQHCGLWALLDDMNTPEAIAALHAAAKTLEQGLTRRAIADAKAELLVGGALAWAA